MKNSQDLNQAIMNMQREAERAGQELKAKDEEQKKLGEEIPRLKQEIITLNRELEEKKRHLADLERNLPKIIRETNLLKQNHMKNHAELERIQKEYTEALKESGMKMR